MKPSYAGHGCPERTSAPRRRKPQRQSSLSISASGADGTAIGSQAASGANSSVVGTQDASGASSTVVGQAVQAGRDVAAAGQDVTLTGASDQPVKEGFWARLRKRGLIVSFAIIVGAIAAVAGVVVAILIAAGWKP